MSKPLMPKGTAIWLLDNTTLTFEQIADYCGLHTLEIQAIADGEIAAGMAAVDPIANEELSMQEIDRCSKDSNARLRMLPPKEEFIKARGGGRYTPVSKRADKPDAIAWLLKHHPELSDAEICRLLGTTSPTIKSIRERSHRNIANIKSRNPVALGLCTEDELRGAIERSGRKISHEE